MTARQRERARTEENEDMPDVVPEQRAQVVPVGSMDVDPATGAAIRVGTPETDDENTVGAFLVWLQEEADAENADRMAILAQQLRQADTAQSLAEALRETTTVNGKDYVDRPFMATGFRIHEGKFEDEDIPFFASIEATSPDHPQGFIVNCGGDRVLVHLRTLRRFNAFPVAMKITSRETRKKRVTLSIEILRQAKA